MNKHVAVVVKLVLAVVVTFAVASCGGGSTSVNTAPNGTQNALGEGNISSPVQLTSGSAHSGWIASTVTGGFSYYVFTPNVSGTYTVSLDNAASGTNLSWMLSTSPSYLSSSASCNSGVTLLSGTVTCPSFMSSGVSYYILVSNPVWQAGPNVTYEITVDTAEPHAPSGVSAVSSTAGTALVTWGPVTAVGTVFYNLYWSTAPVITTGPSSTATKIVNVTSPYAKTGLTSGVRHYFVVTASNQYGEGPASQEVSATIQ